MADSQDISLERNVKGGEKMITKLVTLFCMSFIYHIPLLRAAIAVIAFLTGIRETEAVANQTRGGSPFEEHPVEFHNQGVKLAGSLL